MFDKERIGELLNRIEEAVLLIQSKSGLIKKPDDFLLTQDGMFLLSGIRRMKWELFEITEDVVRYH